MVVEKERGFEGFFEDEFMDWNILEEGVMSDMVKRRFDVWL